MPNPSESAPSGLFLIREDGSLVGLSETAYDSEALLQELLAKYPALMAGDQIDSAAPRRWLLITREVGIPGELDGSNRWSLDHLFVDQDGVPTLVEVKRSSDTRIRREVVGQMLDYAANAILHWPIEVIQAAFERRCEREHLEPAQELAMLLGANSDATSFWASVKTNLQAGKIRMLFVADVIPSELRRIVEFLNQQMDPAEVLAIEVRQYTGQGLKTLVPKVMGQTAQAERQKSAGRGTSWDEHSFFAKLAEHVGSDQIAVARRLFDWANTKAGGVKYGRGPVMASFHANWIRSDGEEFRPFGIYAAPAGGSVEIPLGWTAMRLPPFDESKALIELVRRVNAIDGLRITEEINRRPSIPLTSLGHGDRLERFLAVMDWAIERVRAGR